MNALQHPHSRLVLILFLIAIHSFLVGIGLIIRPGTLMLLFGFNPGYERFFPTQGGVFHIVMAIGYTMAALRINDYRCLIIFSIIVKSIAAVYLFIYYALVDSIWIVLVSGIGDGLMALAILFALLSFVRYEKSLAK
ncbi:hypothetical protein KKG05_11515 [bacterium]|nr:hypothetical protein [bacterium]